MSLLSLSCEELDRSLAIRDLSDPKQGPHAMQIVLDEAHRSASERWRCRRLIYRSCPIVTVDENYDDLGYPSGGVARDARYTRYVSARTLLRTQASAGIPRLLRALAADPPDDMLLVCVGLAYRCDVIDRHHVGEPHQLDLWRLRRGQLTRSDLREMIETIIGSVLPGREHRVLDKAHPYTVEGWEIEVRDGGEWVEIGECGLTAPTLLERCGHDPARVSGLAMGLGLDRLLMLRKGIPDIRLLRSSDPRVVAQMQDLLPYRPVSNQPAIARDLSVAVAATLTPEELGDRVREALREHVDCIETLSVLSETLAPNLPESARRRMGLSPDQKNVLLRLVIRHSTRTLTSDEANQLRDRVYVAIHEGQKKDLARR